MNPKLSVVSLWAEDVIGAAHYYRDVLGLPMLPHHGEMPHFDLGGAFLVILEGTPLKAQAGSTPDFPLLAFEVGDLDEAVERLQEHNVDLSSGIVSSETSRWVKFFDPAGNLIELVEYHA
jgi:catechol-2,3-dioxygenase